MVQKYVTRFGTTFFKGCFGSTFLKGGKGGKGG